MKFSATLNNSCNRKTKPSNKFLSTHQLLFNRLFFYSLAHKLKYQVKFSQRHFMHSQESEKSWNYLKVEKTADYLD